MNLRSRRIIYLGMNFVFSPPPTLDSKKQIVYQESLIRNGIHFTNLALRDNMIEVAQGPPAHLVIRVLRQPGQPIGQLLVFAENPNRSLEVFIQETEATINDSPEKT